MTVIQLEDVHYEVSDKVILNKINLDVRSGEILSVMGQSGSGKTTLLKLMTGLICPSSGHIRIDDQDICTLTPAGMDIVRLKMGLVFQYAALLDSLTVYENIVFAVRRHRPKTTHKQLDALVERLLEAVQLEGLQRRFPAELSGGQQKRVGLARALAMEPSLIFYDEPTSGLDPLTCFAIDTLIVETRKRFGVTSVVVSHNIPSVRRISDRVALLSNGDIHCTGTPDEMMASPDPVVNEFMHADDEHLAVSETR